MTEKNKTPRQVLLKRKRPKPLKLTFEYDWYANAYARFSISAKSKPNDLSKIKNVPQK